MLVTKEELRSVGILNPDHIEDLAKDIILLMNKDKIDLGLIKEAGIQILDYVKDFQRMSRAIEISKQREIRRTESMIKRSRR